MAADHLTAYCDCGAVEIDISGAPILAAICHCDDCQAAAAALEALPGALRMTDEYGGTPLVLLAPDRVRVVKGKDLLKPYRLRPDSPTKRLVATCCNSTMMLSFDKGPYWVSVLGERIADPKPAPDVRVQTKYVPEGVSLPDSPPKSAGYAISFVPKLLGAGAAYGMRKLIGSR